MLHCAPVMPLSLGSFVRMSCCGIEPPPLGGIQGVGVYLLSCREGGMSPVNGRATPGAVTCRQGGTAFAV